MSKAVLIVEDDARFRAALERVVGRLGYPTQGVADGVEALQSIRESVPGLVLLDLLLPRRDGFAVLEELRARDEWSAISVVVMSGVYKDAATSRQLEELGCSDFLEKPFNEEPLANLLRKYLGRPEEPEQKSETPDRSDSLAKRNFAETLWQAMQEGASGCVRAENGQAKKAVLLEHGRPVAIKSNRVRECLGQRLLSAGTIDQATLDQSLARMKAESVPQGEALVGDSVLDPESLARELEAQGRDKLAELFGWEEGRSWFEPDMSPLARATSLESWDPQALLLDAIEGVARSHAQRALSGLEGAAISVEPEKLSAESRALGPVAKFFDTLERGADPAEAAAEHAPTLYGLVLVGAVSVQAPEGAEGVAVSELQELLERQASQNYFEVLGVRREAGADDLRSIFFRLAKQYHPDRFAGDDAARDLARKVFARMTEAHETLADPGRRRAYEQRLSAAAEGSGAAGNDLVRAEMQFHKGLALLKQRDYAGALAQLDEALQLDPEEGEFEALYGWAYYLAHPDLENAASKAEAHLENALKLSPNSAVAHHYSGLLHKACGDPSRAETMFKKVVSLDPNHVEAARELRLINMRREPQASKSERLFGFGKRKK